MLTSQGLPSSASQYFHPDYLQPLPTTLDAKKSPLALLAQTCSSIGKDSPKTIIPPLDKKDGKESASRKSDSPSSKSTDGSPEDDKKEDKKREGTPSADKSGFRAPAPKDIPPLVPIPGSPGSKSPSTAQAERERSTRTPERDSNSVPSSSQVTSTASSGSGSRINLSCGNLLLEVSHNDIANSAAKTSLASTHAGLHKPESISSSSLQAFGAYPGCAIPLPGHPHGVPLDASSASSLHQAALAAHGLSSKAGLPSHGLPGHAHGVSPYTYARVKTSSGATTLVPICRDPYCTNCQITMQNAQLTSSGGPACAAGCTQCNHEKSVLSVPTSLAGGLSTSLGTVPVLSLTHAGASHLTAPTHLPSSLYSHAFGVLPGHNTLPYMCNWMAGGDYCGKRFTTSEELLQHLRTHTSPADLATLTGLSAAGYPTAAAFGLAAPSPLCHTTHYPTPGSLSPNSLRQAYPRSFSPNSLLAARYHPYKSPLASLQTAPSGLPGAVPSGLAHYYSPYALYGQRLGAAVAP